MGHSMVVTDNQLYLAIGLPVFAVLVNILVGMMQFGSITSRFSSIDSSINSRFNSVDARFNSIDARFSALDARFETLIGKVIELDNRLTRVEAILDRH